MSPPSVNRRTMAMTGLKGRDAVPTDARQMRSREALTGALLALLYERPFDRISIREISLRAGTGYATFFRHYATKEALLGDIAAAEISALLGMTTPLLYQENSLESSRALCGWVDRHRHLWQALLTGGAAGIVREEFVRQARTLPREPDQSASWLPTELSVVYGAGATIDVLAWWLSNGQDHSTDAIATILNRLIIAPLVGTMAHDPGSAT